MGNSPVLFPGLQSGEGLPALNALAERLTSLDSRQRTAFEGAGQAGKAVGTMSSLCARLPLSEQAKHCQVAPEATDDASLGRVYAANSSIPEVKDVPDKVFELLDFQLLGRRIRQSAGGVFTRQGYVVPDGNWEAHRGPGNSPSRREAPTGFFRLELRLGEEQAELTLPRRTGAGGGAGADGGRGPPQLRRHRLPQPGTPASGSVGHAGAAGYPELPGHPADGAGGAGLSGPDQVQRRCWRCRPFRAWRMPWRWRNGWTPTI